MPEVEAAAHTEAVAGVPEPIQKLQTDVMQVSEPMVLLTWLAFGIAAVCLHKLLWKPILGAVAKREQSISDALGGAADARREMAESGTRSRKMIEQAAEEARGMAERASREAAASVARADREAKLVAQRRLAEAELAVAAEQRKAAEAVRLDAAMHLSETIETLLRQKLTDEQKRVYQADILKEVKV